MYITLEACRAEDMRANFRTTDRTRSRPGRWMARSCWPAGWLACSFIFRLVNGDVPW